VTYYSLDKICDGLRRELQSLIVKISPTERGSERFTPRDPQMQGDIRENTGKARTFWLEPMTVKPLNVGATTRRYEIAWDLVVGYPPSGWETAAISDYDDLRASVNIAGGFSAVNGVGFRVMPAAEEAGLRMERAEKWLWVTSRIVSIVETTSEAKVLPQYQTKTTATVTPLTSPKTITTITPTVNGVVTWEYHVDYGTEASRGGWLVVSWDLSSNSVVYYDESSDDVIDAGSALTDTTDIEFSASMAAGVVSLTASAAVYTWTVRLTELARSA
jgi:hypothetical protein